MPERITSHNTSGSRRSCEFQDLGLLEYTRALALQQEILASKLSDRQVPDRLLFVQHPAVYTLGRRGGRENLVVSEDFLAQKGIRIVQTDRGGNITYHGPGQAVLYPVIDLERNRLSVPEFVEGLEEVMKHTCAEFDVPADRDERNHGLWVGNKKIGSVGIALKKGISIHGLALNINPDLAPFTWINPCGLANQAMSSIALERTLPQQTLEAEPSRDDRAQMEKMMDKVKTCFVKSFSAVFDCSIKPYN
ncbi:MAG TPA: lipoyl(octanoyl) transferase [Desulfobacteraceae bacterium]|nr:lipoyl(octanoyl) transferase [Desulfobacteraceae bacterium]